MKRHPKAVRAPIPFRPRQELKDGGRPMKLRAEDRQNGSLSRILGVPASSSEAPKKELTAKETKETKQAPPKQNNKKNNNSQSTVHPFLSGLSVYVDGVSASAYLSRPPAAGIQQNAPAESQAPPPPTSQQNDQHHHHHKEHNKHHPNKTTERSVYWADFISLVVIICCWIVLCLCGMHYVSNVDDTLIVHSSTVSVS